MESEQFEVNNKQIFICEKHHHVLKFWQQFSSEKPYLLTFDHHTDLHPAFVSHLNGIYTRSRREPNDAWITQQSRLVSAIVDQQWKLLDDLRNDEHIDTAIKAGFIKKALVYSHDSYHGDSEDVYHISGNEEYSGQRIINNSQSYHAPATIINSAELAERFLAFDLCLPREEWSADYILDIDLDFFQTRQSIMSEDSTFFRMLAANAKGISIAKESGWIAAWRREHDPDITVDFFWKPYCGCSINKQHPLP